jgi:hypothetical protein
MSIDCIEECTAHCKVMKAMRRDSIPINSEIFSFRYNR